MQITWDEPKRLSNLDKHGLDFAELEVGFFLEATILPARRGRFQAIGLMSGRAVVAVFTRLGTEALSVVSLRSANRKERMLLK